MTTSPTREAQHGTIIEYVTWHCRCSACRENWQENREMFYDSAGRATVPSDACRDYIAFLMRYGYTYQAIATMADISPATVRAIVSGNQPRVSRKTSDLILDIYPDDIAPGHRVPALLIESMFNRLKEMGLSRAAACALANLPSGWAYRQRRTVSWDSYMALRRVFVALTNGGEGSGSPA